MSVFASVISFEEDAETIQHGIEHVLADVVPAMTGQPGVSGWWLVDHEGGRRLSVMVFEDQAAYDTAMQAITELHAKNGGRPRPRPASVTRFEVYASV